MLVELIHSEGAIAKLHICGNTESIMTGMIKTGADIIDVDHLVPSLSDFTSFLGPHQVFSGKSDPVSIIQSGSFETILESVIFDFRQAGGRCIISAGCEITPETSVNSMNNFKKTAEILAGNGIGNLC